MVSYLYNHGTRNDVCANDRRCSSLLLMRVLMALQVVGLMVSLKMVVVVHGFHVQQHQLHQHHHHHQQQQEYQLQQQHSTICSSRTNRLISKRMKLSHNVLFVGTSTTTAVTNEHIRKSGGGIPTKEPGNNSIFDPSVEGKVVGGSFNDRIRYGHQTPPTPPVHSSPSPVITSIDNNYDSSMKATSVEHIKKAGYGIATKRSGNNCIFDPAMEGKVGISINERIRMGPQYRFDFSSTTSSATAATVHQPVETQILETQHWLEDIGIPTNFVKPTSPVEATVLGRMKLITDDAPGNIQHIIMKLPIGFHYIEGQSLYVIPPGIDRSTNKPYKPRLYSIASTRYGDLLDGNTVSLCVREAEYYDPTTKVVDPDKAGVCSTFLCNTNPGDTVMVAGPVGKTMILPEDLSKDIIMVATGTGIAPFRAFLHRLFMENTVARHMYTGNAWLILGVPTTGGLLYTEEINAMISNSAQSSNNKKNLEVTYAISREMYNAQGGKYYVQDVLKERATELFERLDNGGVIYFCGLRGMMPGILDALEEVATQRGIDWTNRLKQLIANHQWHVEVD